MCICQMICHNLTICSYCFNVYAFDDININLITSSYTLHSRKFPTKPSVHICIVLYMTLYRLHLISFSFLKYSLYFATWFLQSFTITQLQPSRFYPIVSKTISTCTGLFPVIPVVLSYRLVFWISNTFEYVYSHLFLFLITYNSSFFIYLHIIYIHIM